MIKMMVTDMDGTFLDDNKQYDQRRFFSLYQDLQGAGILFVAASGNQYQRLMDYFPTHHQELTFISDNGAMLVEKGQITAKMPVPSSVVAKVLRYVAEEPLFYQHRLVVCGETSAYLLERMPLTYREKINHFYRQLKVIEDYHQIQEPIYKLAFNFPPEKKTRLEAVLNQRFGGEIVAKTSGHLAVDVVAAGVGKEVMLRKLCIEKNICLSEVAAFGDNLNDLGMLEIVGHSFATANARPEVQTIVSEVIGSNQEQAVLDKMAALLKAQRK